MALSLEDFNSIVKDNKDNIIKMDLQPTTVTPNDTINSENFSDILKTPQEGTDWSDVPLRAITNIPQSATEFGKNIYQAVSHPLQTAGGVWDLAAGALHNITPAHIADWIDKADWNPEAKDRAVQTANAVGHIYKNRYGSSEGFKEALSTDPVGVASDVATLLSGGAGLASKTGLTGKLTESAIKAGVSPDTLATASKVAQNINPITAASNAVGAAGKNVIGLLTGTGPENIANAAKAGFTGDTSFWKNLTGESPMNAPLDAARSNLATMKANRSNTYRSGMTDITGDKSILNFNDIDKALDESKKSISFGKMSKDDVAAGIHQDLTKEINKWRNLDPAEYHTPEGLDALKQRIGAITNRIPYEEANSNRIGTNVYNAVKDTVSNQAPKYAEVMSDYHDASDTIKEIEKALSLGNKASADTALRKLQSLTRNNVNTNYGQRLNLAQQLETEGGQPFINALSGQAMSSPVARGLAGTLEGATGIASFANPQYLAALPFQSPKLMGMALYGGGKAAKAAKNIGFTQSRANALANLLNVSNKANENQ